MKKLFLILACCLLLTGCGKAEPAETVELANPWVDYASLAEAEEAVGFPLDLPETVAGSYQAQSFRVMNGNLLEVTYLDEPDFQVTVRKMAGENQDISGVYEDFKEENTTELDGCTITNKLGDGSLLTLVSREGYSYSLYAPNHYWGDSHWDFLVYATGQRPPSPTWAQYDLLEGAEAEVGFSLDLPETVGEFHTYTFRVMDGSLLEAVYQCREYFITVHKIKGEGPDPSLDSEEYHRAYTADDGKWMVVQSERGRERLTQMFHDGYSYFIYSPTNYPEDAVSGFLNAIYG